MNTDLASRNGVRRFAKLVSERDSQVGLSHFRAYDCDE